MTSIKTSIKYLMKLPDKNCERLSTKNYMKVNSDAVISIDYYSKLKILKIQYKTGKVYHYLKVSKNVWKKFLELANQGHGLGTFINQDFKNYD